MMLRGLSQWVQDHPARAGTIAGWYQQACSTFAALIAVPLVMRHLGDTDAGLWFSFIGTLAVLQLTDFGLSFVMARQVAYSLRERAGQLAAGPDFIETRGGWGGISDVFTCSRRIFGWLILVSLVTLIAIYEVVLPQGQLLTQATPGTRTAWYCLGGAVVLSLQNKPYQALLDGLAKTYVTRFLSGTTLFISGFGALGVLLLGGRLPEMAGAVAVTSVMHCLALRGVVRRVAGSQLEPVTQLPAGLLRRFLRVATPMGVLNLSAFCVSSVQVPLLGFLLGPKMVPAFFLAQRIGQMLSQAVMQLSYPQLPLFTRELAARNPVAARKRMRRTITFVSVLGCVAAAGFVWLSPWFVSVLVGPDRYVPTLVLALMGLDCALGIAAAAWGQFVLASGSNPFVVSTLLAGTLNVTLLVLLVGQVGIVGVPLAALSSCLVTNYWFNPWRGWRLLRELGPAPGASA